MSQVDDDAKLVLGLIKQLMGRDLTEAEEALVMISFRAGVQTGLEWKPDPNRNK